MRILGATAAALSVAMLAAPVAAADESAGDVVRDLRAQGYFVVIDRIGTGALERCVVADIRTPTAVRQMRIAIDDRAPTPVRHTITVSLDCTG